MRSKIIGWFFLISSYLPLFLLLLIYSEFSFAPWDSAVFNIPEPGTWQRSLNDFFDLGIGSSLLALAPILLSIIQISRSHRKFSYLRIIVSNLLMPFLFLFSFMLISFINNSIFPAGERSYYHALLPLIAYLGLNYLWLNVQKQILQDAMKAKNIEKAKHDFSQLEDNLEEEFDSEENAVQTLRMT